MDIKNHKINGYNIKEYSKCSIYVIEDAADYDFCDKIIDFINNSELTKSNDNDEDVQCKYLHLDKYNNDHREIDYIIYQLIHKIFLTIMKHNPYILITGDTIYHLRKIHGGTKQHTDDVRASFKDYLYNKVRCLALVLSLNDNYDGGEFNFPNHDVKIKLKKGSILLFPSFWTHPHEVSSVGKNQIRYTVTTWGTEDVIVN